MKEEDISKFQHLILHERFISAYEMIINDIEQNGLTTSTINLSKELSNKLRGKAYILSCRKADNEAMECEALLRLTVKINGESIYG